MLDLQLLRQDLDAVVRGLGNRGLAFDRDAFERLERERKRVIQEAETLKAERNRVSEEVGRLKREKQDASALIEQQRTVGEKLKALEHAEKEAEAAFRDFLALVPNLPHGSVPVGKDEHANTEIKRWGAIPALDKPLDHTELGARLGILDFDRAAKLSGARFSVLKGLGAKLERALASFMLDRQIAAGYTEVIPPYLVNAESLYGTGQLPKFEQDLFKTPRLRVREVERSIARKTFGSEAINYSLSIRLSYSGMDPLEVFLPAGGPCWFKKGDPINVDAYFQLIANSISFPQGAPEPDEELVRKFVNIFFEEVEKDFEDSPALYLIPTAEVPVTNLYRDEVISTDALPMRHCALTPCFRSEAGSYGKDTKGLVRQHQFHKVELVSFCTPEQAEEELERLTGNAEAILEALELPYRRVLLCTGDMGFSSQKTYDLEVWVPSQNTYREISSCSWFGDFQARRGNIKYKKLLGERPATVKAAGGKEMKAAATFFGSPFVHTLNGSGLAVGRTWLAVLENNQRPDGSVAIPKALQPYMGCDEIR